MKYILRSFALGILTATVLIGVIYFAGDSSSANEEAALTTEKATTYLENEGLHVVEQKKWKQLNQTLADQQEQLEIVNNIDNPAKDDEKTNKDSKEKNKNRITVTIDIESGMATSEVANLLKEKQMIDNAGEFESYLAEHGYEKAVQIGSFEVHSDMDFYQIAETITN
ncbi:hypothetical protein GCM10008986_04150 [Salinibacillus aidingensis]|uniref:YceG-like family protein n=1 Tax=Salinibacillus aidingensis TaxID=237684 RepID=A0ABP3KM15_9BACI